MLEHFELVLWLEKSVSDEYFFWKRSTQEIHLHKRASFAALYRTTRLLSLCDMKSSAMIEESWPSSKDAQWVKVNNDKKTEQ